MEVEINLDIKWKCNVSSEIYESLFLRRRGQSVDIMVGSLMLLDTVGLDTIN